MLENTEQNMYKNRFVIVEMHIRRWTKSVSVLQKLGSDVHVHIGAWKEEFRSFPE